MFDHIISLIYYCYLRPIIKWILFKLTRLHELQRICYGAPGGSVRIKKVEKSLELSKTPQIKTLVGNLNTLVASNCKVYRYDAEDEEDDPIQNENAIRNIIIETSVATVLKAKRINPRIHPDFSTLFAECVEQIWGYKQLYYTVEELRTTLYDFENLDHEKKLLELWDLLMPNVPLEGRISKQWQDIGFQGDDPKTDFRGMGILGLENLLYFAREYNNAASHVLLHSLHPQYGYTFAIVGINLTSMAWNLLKSGMAKTHFYNLKTEVVKPKRKFRISNYPTLKTFHEFYCYLFYEFDKYWINCKPRSIMDFPYIQENFELNILRLLENNKTIFKINLAIEDV